jgi:hypothetical protein
MKNLGIPWLNMFLFLSWMCIFKCCKYCEDEGHRYRLVSLCLVDIYSETLELFDWVVMAGNGSVRILLVWWLQRLNDPSKHSVPGKLIRSQEKSRRWSDNIGLALVLISGLNMASGEDVVMNLWQLPNEPAAPTTTEVLLVSSQKYGLEDQAKGFWSMKFYWFYDVGQNCRR